MIADPPSDEGADHVNVFDPPFPVDLLKLCGALGVVIATGVTVFEYAAVDPPEFVAVTRQRIDAV